MNIEGIQDQAQRLMEIMTIQDPMLGQNIDIKA